MKPNFYRDGVTGKYFDASGKEVSESEAVRGGIHGMEFTPPRLTRIAIEEARRNRGSLGRNTAQQTDERIKHAAKQMGMTEEEADIFVRGRTGNSVKEALSLSDREAEIFNASLPGGARE